MAIADQESFNIAGWHVDPASFRISNNKKTIKLEPRAMAVLVYLAGKPGMVVTRQELEEKVWAGTVVGYDAISNAIIKLRKAFGDKARKPHFIETIAKSGYRLVAEVSFPECSELSGTTNASVDRANSQVGHVTPDAYKPERQWWHIAIILLITLLVVITWWQARTPEVGPTSINRMALPLPDKPSIAVLPFTNLSDDPQQEYFADGMTDDLITDISKISSLFVIARNSAFTYKGKAVKVRRVAEELGVRYVMEGSVRRVGNQVRINAQLIDASTGGHIWAERYDGSLDDVFKMQDRITRNIVSALAIKLTEQGKEKLSRIEAANSEAYDAILRGREHYRRNTPDSLVKAVSYFKLAVELDPDYSRAYSALAASYWNLYQNEWWRSIDAIPTITMEKTRLALRKAMEQPNALTHQIVSERYAYFDRKPDRAIAQAKLAIALDRNDPAGHLAMSTALLKAGRGGEALESVQTAMRLDPHYPPSYLTRLGQIQLTIGQYEDAVVTLETAAKRNPDDDWTLVYLAAAYGYLGRLRIAKNTIERANVLRAKAGWGAMTVVATHKYWFRWVGDGKILREGLRKAGVEVGGKWHGLIYSGASGDEVEGATTIDLETAKALHDRDVLFIDVSVLWLQNHIPGARFLSTFTAEFNEVRLRELVDKTQEFVIYDNENLHSRTSVAVAQAVGWGFEHVYFFPDGFAQWKAAGYPIETGK